MFTRQKPSGNSFGCDDHDVDRERHIAVQRGGCRVGADGLDVVDFDRLAVNDDFGLSLHRIGTSAALIEPKSLPSPDALAVIVIVFGTSKLAIAVAASRAD